MTFSPSRLRSSLATALVSLAFLTGASAEEKLEFPAVSQHELVKQRVALTDVEIDYSRPNKNEREIFGSLVPFGKLWRTGANAPTRIKFSGAVKLEGKDVPAGEYALFTIPGPNEWTVIFSKDAKVQSAADYKEENDAARVTVKPVALPAAVETFTIGLAEVKGATATLQLDWDKTRVPVKLVTDDVEKLSQQLAAAVQDGKALDPRFAYQAASFYYDNNKDMNQAAKWADQALEKNPDAYFMHFKRAQIQAKLGNKKEAAASAQKTIELLQASKDPDQAAIKNAQQLLESVR